MKSNSIFKLIYFLTIAFFLSSCLASEKTTFEKLCLAIKTKNNEKIKIAINNGFNVNFQDKYGFTLLMEATRSGNREIFNLLLSKGANIFAKTTLWHNEEGLNNSVILIAAKYNKLDFLKTLVSKGVSIETRGYARETLLMHAVEYGHFQIVKYLISKGAKVNETAVEGRTALLRAAENGSAQIVKLLIRHGANVNAKHYLNTTILMKACENGHLGVVKILINHGADIFCTDSGGVFSALSYASHKGHLNIVKYLVEKGALSRNKQKDGINALVNTFRYGGNDKNIIVIDYLVKIGINLNGKDIFGRTVLWYSVRQNSKESVLALIKLGANVNLSCTGEGEHSTQMVIPLMVASKYGYIDIMQILIKAGANVNAKDGYGQTPLYYAVLRDKYEACKLLITNGADVNACTNFSAETILETAYSYNRKRIIKLLEKAMAR
jgi:ankyrin repeat protein